MSMAQRFKRIAERLAAQPTEAPARTAVVSKTKREFVPMFTASESYGTKWDSDGKAYCQKNGGQWERREELDFGTPMGDLLIDPWMQDALKKGTEQP